MTLLEVLDRAAEKVGDRFADQPELERALRDDDRRRPTTDWRPGRRPRRKAVGAASGARSATRDRPRPTSPRRAGPHPCHRGRRDAEVLEMAESAAEGLERTLGPDHPDTLDTLEQPRPGVPGRRQAARGDRPARAGPRRPDRRAGRRPPRHPHHANNLAVAYRDAGRLPEAIALLERVRDARDAKLGPDHPDTLTTLEQPRRGVPGRRQAAPRRSPCTSESATPGSPSSAPTTPTP